MNKSVKYEGIYQIRSDEVSPDKTMKATSILKLMQEGSMQNSLDHGFSVWDLEAENISWVLVRKKLDIHQYPLLSQKVKLVTYPIMTENILASRDFKLYDTSSGSLLASASSTWTLINLESRKLQRIPERFKGLVAPEEEELLEQPPSKFQKPLNIDFEKVFSVNWFDTDWNDHANNVFFVKCMIESTPIEIIKSHKVKSLVYHIRAESKLEDDLKVKGEKRNGTYLYSMERLSDGKAVAHADIKWA